MAEYFSHDYDTRSDEKIMDLMAEMSWAGYGLFWGIVELLYQNDGVLQRQYKRIAFALGSNEASVKSIVEDFNLFSINDTEFWSESVNKRLYERSEKSRKARESANYRWKNKDKDANAMRAQSDSNAIKESIVKKEKNNKEKYKQWLDETSNEKYKSFINWFLKENCEQCLKLNDHLTEEKFVTLITKHAPEKIKITISAMENKADLTKRYKSFSRTLTNWLNRD